MASTTAVTSSYSRADWAQGYTTLATEQSYWLEDIEGTIPAELEGTLFRNGPGRLHIGDQPYGHPFDGDGMIVAFTFQQGRVHFRNRYVATPELAAELAANRVLYRGVFGTQKPGGILGNMFDLKFKNPANTNVIYVGGKLLALWEASSPYRLDPASLATLGKEEFGGGLKPNQPFTAHPRHDPQTGDWWGFGVDAGLTSTLSFYRLSGAGELMETSQRQVPGFCFLHDFVLTPNYQIFFQNPVKFNPLPFVFGLRSAGECLELDPKAPTKILIFDRQGQQQTITTDPCFIFHHVNGYEMPGKLVVESVCYEEYLSLDPNQDFRQVDFATVPAGQLCRFTIDLATGQVDRQVLGDRPCEFPVTHPRWQGQAHRYVYLGATDQPGANAPLQAIQKIDGQTGAKDIHSFAPRGFIGEPTFVPKPGETAEDAGWILVLVYNAAKDRSELVILDAQALAAAPLAVLPLKHHVPYGLHGMFTTDICGGDISGANISGAELSREDN